MLVLLALLAEGESLSQAVVSVDVIEMVWENEPPF
jgi:hypothetical protein